MSIVAYGYGRDTSQIGTGGVVSKNVGISVVDRKNAIGLQSRDIQVSIQPRQVTVSSVTQSGATIVNTGNSISLQPRSFTVVKKD